ncbi:MAG: DUF2786 domain-containing protein [Chitinophagaceae bacterium]|nr:DUF2786 domain-containing protein [Oligoflexus sp.]
MTDFAKIQKLLNLTSSVNDSEALSALRMAQKYLGKNLGDYLADEGGGLSTASAEKDDLYVELEALFEAEVDKVAALKKQNDDKEKTLRKNLRDIQNFKRDVKAYEQRIADLEEQLNKVQPRSNTTSVEEQLETLEKLFDEEVAKNEKLTRYLNDKDKSLKKATRDVSNLKREGKSNRRTQISGR